MIDQIEREIEQFRSRERELLELRAREEAQRGVYRCVVCLTTYVDPGNGEDTCASCARAI